MGWLKPKKTSHATVPLRATQNHAKKSDLGKPLDLIEDSKNSSTQKRWEDSHLYTVQ
jgi:hypothetical protein